MPTVSAKHHRGKVNGKANGRSNGALRERSEDILGVAAKIFASSGYRNTDVQVVADALNIGKGTIYRMFPTKRALFLAAVDRGMRLLHQAVMARVDDEDDPLEQIACAVRAFLDFFAANPDLVELLIQERAEFRHRAKPTYLIHREANIGRWNRLYRRLIADGRVRDIPVPRITDVLSRVMYGTIFINFFTGRKKSSAAQADDILDIVFNGILAEKERRS